MKKLRLETVVSEKEKIILVKASKNRSMTISDYIRYRLFHNNSEISTDDFVYECPEKDRHDFISIAVIHEIYWMLLRHLMNGKNDEETTEFINKARESTKKSITKYGYLKIAREGRNE
jgi:hypothetical protein